MEVRNLFFNAPARRKFLKSAAAETRAVSEALVGLALANPSVAFSLASGDRVLLDLPPVDDVATRISDLWGPEEASTLLSAGGERNGLGLRGLVQRPDAAAPGFRRAYLFVNGRPFKNPALLRAADRGYRTTTAQGQRPWLFLYLQLMDGSVDVNVHPAKLEVRFQDSGRVESFVEDAVREALAGSESSATLDSQLAPPRMVVRERGSPGRGRGRVEPPHDSQMALFLAGTQGPGDETPVGPTEAGAPTSLAGP